MLSRRPSRVYTSRGRAVGVETGVHDSDMYSGCSVQPWGLGEHIVSVGVLCPSNPAPPSLAADSDLNTCPMESTGHIQRLPCATPKAQLDSPFPGELLCLCQVRACVHRQTWRLWQEDKKSGTSLQPGDAACSPVSGTLTSTLHSLRASSTASLGGSASQCSTSNCSAQRWSPQQVGSGEDGWRVFEKEAMSPHLQAWAPLLCEQGQGPPGSLPEPLVSSKYWVLRPHRFSREWLPCPLWSSHEVPCCPHGVRDATSRHWEGILVGRDLTCCL
nr:uncharacterized protein LOC123568266 [Macaca fascicularis]